MSRPLRVYGVNCVVPGRPQARCIVAAQNMKVAARLFGVSLNYLREFGSETGNARERLIALMGPGRVYQQVDGDYEPLASQEPGR